MRRKVTVTTTTRTGTSARALRRREAVTSLVEPHVVEADALGLLVEALHRGPHRAQAEQVAVPDHGHLLVELPGLLLPQRHALLRIRLARELGLESQNVLVGGPARPARREVDVVSRVVEGAHAGGERVVLLRVVPPLD